MPTEADTCRRLVAPKLQQAGWDDEPHSIAEQRTITDGRIVPAGKGFVRKPTKRVDYLLRYTRDFPLALVEAKAAYKSAADGLQQAKDYAEMLGLKFAYASNGRDIIEFDYFTGLETSRNYYPAPAELWQRYRRGSGLPDQEIAHQLLAPCNHIVGKGERYYQQIAINRVVEAILKGQRRGTAHRTGGVAKDDKDERWDRMSVQEFSGTYGEYLLRKVSKVSGYPSSAPSLHGHPGRSRR